MSKETVDVNNLTSKEAYEILINKEKYLTSISNYKKSRAILLESVNDTDATIFYDKEGNCYVFFTDVYGTIYLVDGLSGKIIVKRKTDCVWESSPVAWGNRIVVGSRGKKIVSFVIN